MGSSHMVVCSGCGHHFRMMSGPGMRFLVLHCVSCGRDKGVGFDAFGGNVEKSAPGLGPYALEEARDAEWPDAVRSKRAELRRRIETIAGPCPCGGTFSLDAPARCPECRSDQFVIEPDDAPVLGLS